MSGYEQWPQEIRELAYEVWAFVAGKNVVQTAKILLRDHGHEVPRATVQYWSQHDAWEERRLSSLRQLAPSIRQDTIAELILGAYDGSRLLRKVIQGDMDTLTLYGRTLPAAVKAASVAIEHGGFAISGTRPLIGLDTGAGPEIDYSLLSPDQLLAIEQEILSGVVSRDYSNAIAHKVEPDEG